MKAVANERKSSNNWGMKVGKMTLDYRDEFGTREIYDRNQSKDCSEPVSQKSDFRTQMMNLQEQDGSGNSNCDPSSLSNNFEFMAVNPNDAFLSPKNRISPSSNRFEKQSKGGMQVDQQTETGNRSFNSKIVTARLDDEYQGQQPLLEQICKKT